MKQERVTDPSSLASQILKSRKYRDLNIPLETAVGLIQNALNNGMKPSKAVDETREKLHNIIAPYLGDPDYKAAASLLQERSVLIEANIRSDPEITGIQKKESVDDLNKSFCLEMLESHASTRERISQLDSFYREIFKITGRPQSILDLACAMHPFGIPWMNLPRDCNYLAFDLHQPRVGLINHYFQTFRICGEATYGDILLHPPQQPADVAFFFKEAHRFDQRQKGCNRNFWQSIKTNWLIVSLPAANLSGTYNLENRQRKLVYETLQGFDWPVTEELRE